MADIWCTYTGSNRFSAALSGVAALAGVGILVWQLPVIRQPGHASELLLVLLVISLPTFTAIAFLVKQDLRSITISADRIVWLGPKGEVRVSCESQDVLPGTFVVRRAQRGAFYEVQTRHGLIKWSSNISNNKQLVSYIQQLANQPDGPAPKYPND